MAKADLYVFAKGVLSLGWLTPEIHMPLCRLLELYDGWNDSLLHSWDEYLTVLRSCYFVTMTSEGKYQRVALTDQQIEDAKNKGLKNLMICLPRGWLKTTLCSQAYPMWRAFRDCNIRVLLAQNTFRNACSKLSMIKAHFESNELLKAVCKEILPDTSCKWSTEQLCVKRTKPDSAMTFEAAGIRTQVTSRHYPLIIEDDTVAPDLDEMKGENLVPTKDDIDQAIGWHKLVTPLLVNPATDQNLVVGTRWFERDLISHILQNEKSFICYMRAVKENENGEPDSAGKTTYPERFNEQTLMTISEKLGMYLFSCLYMNLPIRSQDMIFREEWFTFYDQAPAKLAIFTTVDLGGDPADTGGEPDWNVVLTGGKDMYTGVCYVLHYWRKKCNPGEVIEELFNQVRTFHPIKVGIETVQYQKSILYWIRERMRKDDVWFTIEKLTHTSTSKNMRIQALQPLFASKKLLLRTWMKELVQELLAFPLGAHDDLADTLASQLEMWRLTKTTAETREAENRSNDPTSVSAYIAEIQRLNEKKIAQMNPVMRKFRASEFSRHNLQMV